MGTISGISEIIDRTNRSNLISAVKSGKTPEEISATLGISYNNMIKIYRTFFEKAIQNDMLQLDRIRLYDFHNNLKELTLEEYPELWV